MLVLVIEHFRDNDPRPVYQRLAERGRQEHYPLLASTP